VKLIRTAAARLVVFPELSLSGYHFDVAPIDPADAILSPMIAACAETDSIALVGAPVSAADGRACIGVFRVDGVGASVAYRKVYLGGSEPSSFEPGDGPRVIVVDGWRVGLAVCKDTGVPQHAEETARLGMDVYAAGVLDHAHELPIQEERALRIANMYGVWVATASFAGSTGEGYDDAAGASRIWSPAGNVTARAGTAPGEFARAIIRR
jgi:predicted amidohydrolase